MSAFRVTMLGLVLIAWQYLAASMYDNALLLPELGVILLVVMCHRFEPLQLLAAALTFGYVTDIFGAAEAGSLLAGYLAAAASLVLAQRISQGQSWLARMLAFGLAMLVFHITVGVAGGPIHLRSWVGVVAVQLVAGGILVFAERWAQKAWRPGLT